MSVHRLVRCDSPLDAAAVAAGLIADELQARADAAGSASLAVSGGSSPGPMFEQLAHGGTDWRRVDVFQVDERVAPDGDPARNLTGLRHHLTPAQLPEERLHPMPVGLGPEAAAEAYATTLADVLGDPGVLDVVHLGLGDDGHTASLVPGDEALRVDDEDVAATAAYRGHRRVTLTFPALDRAGLVVWLVAGADKAVPLTALLDGDTSIPAGRLRPRRSVIVCDAAAGPS